jgi:streptogramin lyase
MIGSAYVRTLVFWALAAAATLITEIAPAAAQPFAEYAVPTAGSVPGGLITGPDGNLWFTEYIGNKIGKVTTSGAFIEYTIPTAGSHPYGIAAGPDGNLWFTERFANQIGKVTTSGAFIEYPIPSANTHPLGITAGPDGNLWFAESAGNQIGRVTTSGTITEYPIPTAGSDPIGITAGPDGNLWFAESAGNQIGRVTTSGTITEYPIPTASNQPDFVTGGPDGNLWFVEGGSNKIGKVTTSGTFTEYPIPTASSDSFGITAGPDGSLWFAEYNANKIGKVTTSGAFHEYPIPTAGSGADQITVGPDGNLWFTEEVGNNIGRFNPTAPGPPDHFTCYKVGATKGSAKFPGILNPPGIALVDQFGSSQVAVKKPKFLCAPTDKNGEDPSAPTHPEHLKMYQIKNPLKPVLPTNIKVVDQFNPTGLFVDAKKPSHLLVPTVKSLSVPPPPPGAFVTDHFECYKVAVSNGTPKFVPILALPIGDQFGTMTVDVKKPQFLCNPVDKNGEDPTAPGHVDHLMCYQIKQVKTEPKFLKVGGVFVNNQFGPETLDVKKPAQLCVPALTTP